MTKESVSMLSGVSLSIRFYIAVGRTDVDYFGLDVEGAEYKILETRPFLGTKSTLK